MKDFRLKLIACCCLIIGFIAVLGYAGDIDFTEQVILSMTQEEYDSVRDRLTQETGEEPSEREIAHWWIEHSKE